MKLFLIQNTHNVNRAAKCAIKTKRDRREKIIKMNLLFERFCNVKI